MDTERWRRLMERLHLPPALDTFARLVQVHTAAERHYHNARHIAHCLAELDAAAPHIPDPDPIELALWFHDAVYDPRSASNEADSARWAADFLQECQAPQELSDAVVALILATRHQPGADVTPDADAIGYDSEQWMVDIDLAILGSDTERFTAYERAIRQEYAWVPETVFREKRTAILRSFLDRPAIYATQHFWEKYEARARKNLAESIQNLNELNANKTRTGPD